MFFVSAFRTLRNYLNPSLCCFCRSTAQGKHHLDIMDVLEGLSNTSLILVVALTLWAIFIALQQLWSFYRLSHVPGPRWYSFSLWPLLRSAMGGNLHQDLKRLSDKYGMRLSSPINSRPNRLTNYLPRHFDSCWPQHRHDDRSRAH